MERFKRPAILIFILPTDLIKIFLFSRLRNREGGRGLEEMMRWWWGVGDGWFWGWNGEGGCGGDFLMGDLKGWVRERERGRERVSHFVKRGKI